MKYQEIAQAIVDKMGSQVKAAEAIGVSQPTVHAWLKGGEIKGKNLDLLMEAAKRLGVYRQKPDLRIVHDADTPIIKELDHKFGAGGGGEHITHLSQYGQDPHAYRDESWSMPRTFLHAELRIDPKKALVAEVTGDSGYDPTTPYAPGSLFPGDRVIIDTQDIRPTPPGPFAVFDGFGLVIKLVEIVQGSDPVRFRLSSRNPAYSPYEVTYEEAQIVGRIKGRISRM